MPDYAFRQLDVFGGRSLGGNPLAVVVGADGLPDAAMAAFANWTNLSETTFLLRPTRPEADYRVRIFTPARELPFAGHPTLGSCFAWLAAGGVPRGEEVVQECAAGLIRIRRAGDTLSFAAPPLLREGPVEEELAARIARGLGVARDALLDLAWVDNGPGWVAALLRSRAEALAVTPDYAVLGRLALGVVAPWQPEEDGTDAAFEVRGFVCAEGYEDPVTGSLNASLAQWLIRSGRAPARYVASQGTALGRQGRIHVEADDGETWIGGRVTPVVEGRVSL
jgi:PhzF family phenazine biosynthesis protein